MPSRYDEMMKNKPYLPYNIGYLTEAMVAKAKKELGETEEVKVKTIPELRKLVEAETKLSCPTDDTYLLQFLRTRKFNVESAFSLIKNYYDVKRSNVDIYGTYDPESLKRAFGQKAGMCLPYRDAEGAVIYLLKLNKWDPDVTNTSVAVAILTFMLLKCVDDPASQICGVHVLIDVHGVSLKQIRFLTPRHLHVISRGLRNSLPVRFKGVHLYRESIIFQPLWSFFKLFMSEKIKNRIHLHGDSQKSLHKIIPKAILPVEDYGGDNPNDIAAWYNVEAEKYFERYGELTTYGYRK